MLDNESAERLASIETTLGTLQVTLDKVSDKQDEIARDLFKYKGFIGGVVFVISTIWAVLGLMWNTFTVTGNHTPP